MKRQTARHPEKIRPGYDRFIFLALLLLLVPAVGLSQPTREECDILREGSMSLAALCAEPVRSVNDIPYADTGNPMHRLDLYRPATRAGDKLPVIVVIHGGGWMVGSKSDVEDMLMPFVQTGQYAGVSVGYRLSGEARWPAQIHDCKAAIRWIRANASQYGLDADHIGVWGVSAGGHLALMLGVSADRPELEGNIGSYPGVSSKIAAVVNFFGVSELFLMSRRPVKIGKPGSLMPEEMLIGGPLRENVAKARAASPMTYVTENDAPVLTVHGSKDWIVPYEQSIWLDSVLRKAGVPSYFITVRGGGHGNFGFAADDRVKTFFDKYLRGKDVDISTEPLHLPPSE